MIVISFGYFVAIANELFVNLDQHKLALNLRVVAVSVGRKSAVIESVRNAAVRMIDGCLEAGFAFVVLAVLLAAVAASIAAAVTGSFD